MAAAFPPRTSVVCGGVTDGQIDVFGKSSLYKKRNSICSASLTESEGESKDRRVWWLSFG